MRRFVFGLALFWPFGCAADEDPDDPLPAVGELCDGDPDHGPFPSAANIVHETITLKLVE